MIKINYFFNILNSVYKDDISSCILTIVKSIDKGEKKTLTCLNPHSFYLLNHDSQFCNSVLKSDILISDGVGVYFASKLLNISIKEKITGPDLFYNLMSYLNSKSTYSVFFLGSDNKTLDKIKKRFSQNYKNLKLVGLYSPPFKEVFTVEDNLKIIDSINKVSPDILWIGMTQPKQEKWIFENQNNIKFKFSAGIGAHFDYYSGNIKTPNSCITYLNLQWLHRLLQNPKKMWKRNFISTPYFVFMILYMKISIIFNLISKRVTTNDKYLILFTIISKIYL
jgi:N-acetylglucosaminyldiphosphoundecaprenol N-acetyl-beta-D-mannosaminyltransferase